MKKPALIALSVVLAVIAFPSIGKTADASIEIKQKLQVQGIKGIENVQVHNDFITETDHYGKLRKSDTKRTLVIDLNYDSSKEVNDNYGLAVSQIHVHKKSFKKDAQADFIKVNIKRKGELVAELDINQRNDRSMHIYDDQHISSLGMGMPLPSAEFERQKKLIESVQAQDN